MKSFFKTTLSLLIALTMLLSFVGAADNYLDNFDTNGQEVQQKEYKQKFWDVAKTHWAFEAIAELSDRGAISGYPDGSFKPENTVTRAEWAKIMIQAAGLSTGDNSVRFADTKGHWANTYINAAADYLTAFSGNRFLPDQAITREDVTMAMVKLKGYDLGEVDYSVLSKFKDVASISNYMKVYVAVAVEKGLITGFNDNTFRGQATLTRAQAATLLLRAFQYGNDNKTPVGTTNNTTETPSANNSDVSNNQQNNTPPSQTTTTPIGEVVTVGNLPGTYGDTVSQRANMKVAKKGDIYKINISWGSSATKSTEWFFDAEIDRTTGDLVYKNGFEFTVTEKDDGTEGWELESEKCKGRFSFEGSYLVWNDESADLSGRCKFEKTSSTVAGDYSARYTAAKKQLEKYLGESMRIDFVESRASRESRLADQYSLTRGLLVGCFGYNDSDVLLEKLSSVNDFSLRFYDSKDSVIKDFVGNYSATLRDSTCLVKTGNLSWGTGVSIVFSYDNSSFSAEISDFFGHSVRSSTTTVQFIVSLFADNYRDAEFARLLTELYDETDEDFGTFEMYYGGYNLVITVEEAGYSSIDITVSGEKGAKKAQSSNKTTTPSYNAGNDTSSSQQTTTKSENASSTVKNEPSQSKTYHYVSYYAEYVIDENSSGSINTFSKEEVLDFIEEKGATLKGSIQKLEKTMTEYMGDYFKDSETGRYFYLED